LAANFIISSFFSEILLNEDKGIQIIKRSWDVRQKSNTKLQRYIDPALRKTGKKEFNWRHFKSAT
jgi:hypothetical protein